MLKSKFALVLFIFLLSCNTEVNKQELIKKEEVKVNLEKKEIIKLDVNFFYQEKIINTTLEDSQSKPSLAVNKKGDTALAWISYDQDGDKLGLFSRLFDKNGKELVKELQVNTTTIGNQSNPAIAIDDNSNFIVTWEDEKKDNNSYGIFAKLFDKTGKVLTDEFKINSYSEGSQQSPQIATSKQGNFIIVWDSNKQDGSGYGIFAKIFDKTGKVLTDEFQVNTTTNNSQNNANLALDEKDNFVIVWQSNHEGDKNHIFAQRYNQKGEKIDKEIKLSSKNELNNLNPSVTFIENGNFITTWEAADNNNTKKIFFSLYDVVNNKVIKEFSIDNQNLMDSNADITSSEKSFAISWEREITDLEHNVYLQKFDFEGNKLGEKVTVNKKVAVNKMYPVINSDEENHLFVAWEDVDLSFNGIYAKRFDK